MTNKPEPGEPKQVKANLAQPAGTRYIGETEKNLALEQELAKKPWWKRLLRM